MAAFQSSLPGGSHNDFKGCTIIDCIWNATNHSYYVLDVLAWNNQPMLDCEVWEILVSKCGHYKPVSL